MSESEEWEGDIDPLADPHERKHLYSVLDSFRQYRRVAHYNTTHIRRQRFYALPSRDWTFFSDPPFSYLETLSRVDDAIDINADIAEAILDTALGSFGVTKENEEWHGTATKLDLDKTRSTINQLYRDWSSEGEAERSACYTPVFRDLEEAFPSLTTRDNYVPSILVPGAGLGRLVFELFRKGYRAVGNEISYHQLFTSSFILNHTTGCNEWTVHPWVMSFANNLTREHQFRQVQIPDVDIRSVESSGSMGMVMGDFCSVYANQESAETFDAIVTVFFIDTTPNLLQYITAVRNCLKSGGLWSNVGPLLWHFEGSQQNLEESGTEPESNQSSNPEESSNGGPQGAIELTNDEVLRLIEGSGFVITKVETNSIETGYIQNDNSMLRTLYRPSHWTAVKL